MKDAKEKADKEAKEMADELEAEKRGESKDTDKDKEVPGEGTGKPAVAPSSLTNAPQLQGIQPPGVVHIPIGTTTEGMCQYKGKLPSLQSHFLRLRPFTVSFLHEEQPLPLRSTPWGSIQDIWVPYLDLPVCCKAIWNAQIPPIGCYVAPN